MTTMTARKPTKLESLFCGVVAGGVESAVTYPTEFLKTQVQFAANRHKVDYQ